MAIECCLQLALILLLLDSHAQNICRALQESKVVLAKLTFGSTIYFEHTKRRAIALQNDVHRATDTVLNEQFRGSKSLLIFEMIGNYGFARVQSIAGRRG